MKKTTAILFVLCLWAFQGFAQPAAPPSNLQDNALRTWLKQNWYENGPDRHSSLGYNGARTAMYSYIDEEGGKVYCVYSGFNQNATTTTFLDPINAEHTVPQSKFGRGEPMRSDIHHLFPTHGTVNSARGSDPLDDINDSSTDSWYTVNSSNSGLTKSSSIPSSNIDDYSEDGNGKFEPREDHKGNAARAIFYFYTMYPGTAGTISVVGDINTLYQWHLDDPVDDQERTRNNRTAERQGNYNPYINYPDLVARAWGLALANPTVGFSSTISLVLEGQSGTTVYQVQVRLAPAPTSNVTLGVVDANSGTATAGTDYSFNTQNLTFTSSQTTQTVNVTINGDVDPEGNETVVLNLTNVAGNGGDIATGSMTHTLTILEDDGASPPITPIANVRALYSGTDVTIEEEIYIEGVITSVADNTNSRNIVVQDNSAGIVLRFFVDHSFQRGQRVRVDLENAELTDFRNLVQITLPASDVEVLASNVDLPAYQTITIDQFNNGGAEYESELVRIENVTFANANGTAVFNNGDNAGAIIQNGSSTAIVYALAGSTIGPKIIPSGNGAVQGIGGVFRDNRQLIPQVYEEDIFPTGGVITVPLPTVRLTKFPSSIAENGGMTTLTATLSATSADNVTVNLSFSGTATNSADYTSSETSITILAGNLLGTATLTGIDDTEVEGNETILVDISSALNANELGVQQVSITIADDDTEQAIEKSISFASGLTQMKSVETTIFVGYDNLSDSSSAEISVSSPNLVEGVDFETSPATIDGKITLPLITSTGGAKIKITSLSYKNGQVFLQITSTSDGNLKIGSTDLHTVNFSGITGTESDLAKLGFSFYPNPTNGGINIKFDNFKSNFDIELFSLEGRKISTFKISQPQQFVEFPNLNSGLFILKVNLNGQSYFQRVIVE